jgi:hypothetical protein
VAHRPTRVQVEIPRLGEIACQEAGVSPAAIERCIAQQRGFGGRLGALLVQEGHLSQDEVYDLLRRQADRAVQLRRQQASSPAFPMATPLSLCFPCYNEQDVITDVLRGALAVLPAFLDEFEIIVVDDGSQDATSSVVQLIADEDDRVRLVRHEENRGYGAAVTSALRAAHGELICFSDGDGQFNMLDLLTLLAQADKADIVVGYRQSRADNGLRKFNSNSWKWLIRCLMGLKIRDLDCAFKLFPRWVVECLQLKAEGACISAEIMSQCMRGGVAIAEVPVNHYPRSAGKPTGANLNVILKAFRELPIVWQYRTMKPWNRQQPRHREQTSSAWRDGANDSAICQMGKPATSEVFAADASLSSIGER